MDFSVDSLHLIIVRVTVVAGDPDCINVAGLGIHSGILFPVACFAVCRESVCDKDVRALSHKLPALNFESATSCPGRRRQKLKPDHYDGHIRQLKSPTQFMWMMTAIAEQK